jgi:excinuclease ABC subunit A
MHGHNRLIRLRGVEVHNLRSIDLDLSHRKLIVVAGVSGSGKSSLAFDTLYAEGQRRYIESFSAYTRQFLERLPKPEAERIDGIMPAVAVAQGNAGRSNRSTVGTATEVADYLRLLFAKVGRIACRGCGREVKRDTPQGAAEWLAGLPEGTRFVVAFPWSPSQEGAADRLAGLRETGFVRIVHGGRTWDLADRAAKDLPQGEPILVVVDRLSAGGAGARVKDSLETAFAHGGGRARVLVQGDRPDEGPPVVVDGQAWRSVDFSTHLACDACNVEYADPEPRLFSFNSPLGACTACEGFGSVAGIDMDLVVPDRGRTLSEGAIAPWNTPAFAHELEELKALAADFDLRMDVPYGDLTDRERRIVTGGVAERKFGGLDGFFHWLERRKYKTHIRAFLSRWRSFAVCPACAGARLRPEALAVQLGGQSIAAVLALTVREAAEFLDGLALSAWERTVGRVMLQQVRSRLHYLAAVGLAYLPLDRTIRTLSGGEAQRVELTSALGASLVNMLYVLDEPSVGLHPLDTRRLVEAIRDLRDRGNTVVVVDHEAEIIRAADQVVEIGPGAGDRGGKVVFQGTPTEMEVSPGSLTGDYLAGRRAIRAPSRRREPNHGWIRLSGARGHNLRDLTVEFPLGCLCVVTGVSGSGKSTLVEDTLYPALCRRLKKEAPAPCPFAEVLGDGQLDDVMLVDQGPIGRSPRSIPVTYIKAFDEIRHVFAQTLEARTRNYTPSHFSFNVEGGRCNACEGDGSIKVDMQFLADIYMTCDQCHGRRYRPEVLDAKVRGVNIADVLEMTAREAFVFFRGQPKVQARLKRLLDVGLDYLRLGQPANTLSGGEAQRLKLAAYLSAARRARTLFVLDEPTTGLHFADVIPLLDTLEALLAVGHSLIVVEHNLELIKCADWVIDLGPGAAADGGRVVAKGTPEMVARSKDSVTGRFLAEALARDATPLARAE